jgi:peroxiredoxin
MQELGAPAIPFDLPVSNPWIDEGTGNTRSLGQYAEAKAVVIVFTCNHCPYAVHIQQALAAVARTYQAKGVQFMAISANDPDQYPTDGFDAMARRAREVDFPFPYLFDETQEIAKAYGAVCTPDLFVYDAGRSLAYRGRFDETRPGKGTAHGGELTHALDVILATGQGPEEQYPSMGCNIKWKPGNAP